MPVSNVIFEDEIAKISDQSGKTIAITGCTSGTGYWLAYTSVLKNVSLLLMLNRASSRADEAMEKLKALAKETGAETRIETVACDLMSYESTRTSAVQVEELVQEYGGLDVLANNAGIMAFPDKRTDDGFDVQMQTNHLSHFLLTKLLLPSLEAAANSRGEARIVQHSSNARNLSMRQLLFSRTDGSLEEAYFEKSDPQTLGGDSTTANFTRYHMTKLANTVFAMALHEKLQQRGKNNVKSIVCEPGVAATELVSNLAAGNEESSGFNLLKLTRSVQPVISYVESFFFQSAADGACPIIYSSFAKDVTSGDFYIPKYIVIKRGVPFKQISQGKPIKAGRERLTMSKANQELLWRKSEEAIGEMFFDN